MVRVPASWPYALPRHPQPGDVHVSASRTWTWDGEAWVRTAAVDYVPVTQTTPVASPILNARLDGDRDPRVAVNTDGSVQITGGFRYLGGHVEGNVGSGSDAQVVIEQAKYTAEVVLIQFARKQVWLVGSPNVRTVNNAYDQFPMNAATLNVVDTTGFPTSGTLAMRRERYTDNNPWLLTYTGRTLTSFTGVTGNAQPGDTSIPHALMIRDYIGAPILWVSAAGGMGLTDQLDMGGHRIKNVGQPTIGTDALNGRAGMPWRVAIDVLRMTARSAVGAWQNVVSAACYGNGFRNQLVVAQGNSSTWRVNLAVGTWSFHAMAQLGSGSGIATVTLTPVTTGAVINAGTVDLYNAAASVPNSIVTIAGITVPASQAYDLTLTAATKNALASNYQINLQHIDMERTA